MLDIFGVTAPNEEPQILQAAQLSPGTMLKIFAHDKLWDEIERGYGIRQVPQLGADWFQDGQ